MNFKPTLGFLIGTMLLSGYAIAHAQNDKNDWVKQAPATQKLDAAKLAAMDAKAMSDRG